MESEKDFDRGIMIINSILAAISIVGSLVRAPCQIYYPMLRLNEIAKRIPKSFHRG